MSLPVGVLAVMDADACEAADFRESFLELNYASCERLRANSTEARAAVEKLAKAAREAEELLRGLEGISRNNAEQLAHEVGEALRAALEAFPEG